MSILSIGHPVFACASYRDPNLTSTLAHFEKGLREVADGAGIDAAELEQSIIGAIGRIDQPRPPHARGFGETIDRLCGYTSEVRQKLREAVLNATPAQIRAAAGKILDTKCEAIAILGNAAAFDAAAKEGMVFEREKLLKM
jgi:presequence protease